MKTLLTLTLAVATFWMASATAADRAYVDLEKRLTAEQLKATGLDQLSADQLRLLNGLLKDEQTEIVKAAREDAPKSKGFFERGDPIVSRIEGVFQGWSTGTRLKLHNGQVWRVIDSPEYYVRKSKAVADPAVVIAPGLVGGYYLQVEGHSVRAKVTRAD